MATAKTAVGAKGAKRAAAFLLVTVTLSTFPGLLEGRPGHEYWWASNPGIFSPSGGSGNKGNSGGFGGSGGSGGTGGYGSGPSGQASPISVFQPNAVTPQASQPVPSFQGRPQPQPQPQFQPQPQPQFQPQQPQQQGNFGGQCPAVNINSVPVSSCSGRVSNCWSVGEPDVDCPGNGLCCFDGCANVCQNSGGNFLPGGGFGGGFGGFANSGSPGGFGGASGFSSSNGFAPQIGGGSYGRGGHGRSWGGQLKIRAPRVWLYD